MKRALLLILILAAVAACAPREPLIVGSKDFAENRILAHMFALLAEDTGIPVERSIPYGNTFDLQQAIRQGQVDLYPEYTGTGLSMMGVPGMGDPDRDMANVREAFSQYDLAWLERIGMDNPYVLVMRPEAAAKMEAETIGDLAAQKASVAIGIEREFRARPVDGYRALVRHYGFSPRPELVVTDSRVELYRELVRENIDVAVTYRTDPQIKEFGLAVLRDNLGFFPAYQAAPLARKKALQRHPGLEEALGRLSGLLDNGVMRNLNKKVMLDGESPQSVAENFLVRQGLIREKPAKPEQRKLFLATPPGQHSSAVLARALDATRQVFPQRSVSLLPSEDPIEAMLQGEAFMALLGAESFYTVGRRGSSRLRENVEAVAPVGFRAIHLIKRDIRVTPMPFGGIRRLGVGVEGSDSEHAARMLLNAYGWARRVTLVHGEPRELAQQVLQGELDGLLMTAPLGDADMLRILDSTRLVLQPFSQWESRNRQQSYPFFRRTRVGADIYPGVNKPVDTLGSQVVLAGPAPDRSALGDGDPVSGLRTQRQGIPRGIKDALLREIGTSETIDPTLPGEHLPVASERRGVQPINPAPEVSLLTGLLLLGLCGFFLRLARRG